MKPRAEPAAMGAQGGANKQKAPTVSDHKLVVNFGRNCRDNQPKSVTLTMTELARRLSSPDTSRGKLTLAEYLALDKKVPEQKKLRDREKDGEYFIAAEFDRPGTRAAVDIKWMNAFAGDIDSGNLTKKFIQAKLKGLQYIAYSSYSHHSADRRWRFIVPYATPITHAQHKKVYAFFQGQFDGHLDQRSETANQLWYTPACPKDALPSFEFFVGTGSLLDADAVPEVGAAPPGTQLQVTGPSERQRSLSVVELDRLKSALNSLPSDDRQDWITVGLALHREVRSDAAKELWLDWSKKSAKFDVDDALATWNSFDGGDRDAMVTLGSVFYLAKGSGWTDAVPDMPDSLKALDQTHFVAIDGGRTSVFRELFDAELEREYLDRMPLSSLVEFYSNQKITMSRGDDSVRVNKATAWLHHPGRRSYHAICFMPGRGAPQGCYNLWRGFAVAPRAGDWSLLRTHIDDVVCDGDPSNAEYLLNWMAFAIQHPDKPAEVAVVMQGSRGTGKGKLASMFGRLFGQHTLQITQVSHLTGKFNAHLRSCVFLFVDEALWAGDKAGENVLKGLITEHTLTIEGKGQNIVTVPNRLHIMMASNNDWVVPAGPIERRYFVLRVGDKRAQDHAYFAAIDEQMLEHGGLEAMMHDLMQRDLTKFNIRNFPRTAGLDEQILLSLDPETLWWIDHLGQSHAAADWQLQPRGTLQHRFSAAIGVNNFGKASVTRLGMFLSKVLPAGWPTKVTQTVNGGSPLPYYRFPSQTVCKQHLIRKLGLQKDPWV